MCYTYYSKVIWELFPTMAKWETNKTGMYINQNCGGSYLKPEIMYPCTQHCDIPEPKISQDEE